MTNDVSPATSSNLPAGSLAPAHTLHFEDTTAAISPHGATLLSWQVGGQELIDGYETEAEFAAYDGMRSALLAPWSNRIDDARYTWAGCEYDLGPAADGSRQALHGLVYQVDWSVLHSGENTVTYQVTVGGLEAYPWRVKAEATYTLGRTEAGHAALELALSCKNLSDSPAPVGLGWHPYFRLGPVDECRAEIPADLQINPNEVLIPLEGPQAFSPKTLPAEIGSQIIDLAFTQLSPTPARLQGPAGTIEMTSTIAAPGGPGICPPGEGIWHLFTADTLAFRPRTSIALEPCEFMTNAFNRPEHAPALALAPGKVSTLRATCVFHP